MKKLISLVLILSIVLCGCTTGQTDSVPQSSSIVENSSVTDNSSVTESSSLHIEDRWLTVEELNEVNKAFAFKTSAEYPAIRALLGDASDYPVLAVKVLVKRVAERLCGDVYNDKFLDSTNPYLTAEDAEEIEFLKNRGYDFEFDKITSGKLKYARITYSELDRYLQKYMGISCAETSPESWNDNGYIIGGRQYYYGTGCIYVPEKQIMYCKKDYEVPQGSFLCVSGRIQGDKVLLYSENPGEEILTLKNTGESYIVYSIHRNSAEPENTYEKNGLDVYDFMYKPKDVFFEKDATKSSVYNQAIECFNNHLMTQAENWHYPQWGEEYISGYRLYDFEDDGVPEMITRHGTPITLSTVAYTYIDGNLVKDYMPGEYILSNGMVANYRASTYTRYSFYTYNKNGYFDKALVLNEEHIQGGNEFYIDDVQVTEEEYHKTADYYIDLYQKGGTRAYQQFYEEIIY